MVTEEILSRLAALEAKVCVLELDNALLKQLVIVPPSSPSPPSSPLETPVKQQERTKAKAKKNEESDIKEIVTAINDPLSAAGIQLRSAFKEVFGVEVEGARQKNSGGRGTHFDFEVLVSGSWKKVEHKGSKAYKAINVDEPPWTGGVEFFNGTGKLFTLGCLYARQWYDKYIASGALANKYGLTSEIPDYDTWFAKDAMRQGDPTTPFGLELRSKFRGEGAIHLGGGCFDERNEMTCNFIIDDANFEIIKNEVLEKAKEVLVQKDYWLQIHGDINSKFFCKWSPPLTLTSITQVKRIPCSDLLLEFTTDMGFPIRSILRWGKGQGLSNIRIDLR